MCSKNKCYHCQTPILKDCNLLRCIRCQVKLHYLCYANNYEHPQKKYTQCPKCHKIGTMGITQKVIDHLNSINKVYLFISIKNIII